MFLSLRTAFGRLPILGQFPDLQELDLAALNSKLSGCPVQKPGIFLLVLLF
jgi:hypothetical protein